MLSCFVALLFNAFEKEFNQHFTERVKALEYLFDRTRNRAGGTRYVGCSCHGGLGHKTFELDPSNMSESDVFLFVLVGISQEIHA